VTLLEPDRDQIEIFTEALFRHASNGFISVRAFHDDGSNKVFDIAAVPVSAGLRYLFDVAEDKARRAANAPNKIVFCPPIATFNSKDRAAQDDLCEGLTLSVECDRNPQESMALLEGILGPTTAKVKSGGQWIDDDGQAHDKLHLHWRLRLPTRNAEQHSDLKLARTIAALLVGGDPSHNPISHPIRWPGSWHRKATPRLCALATVNPDQELDLATALAGLKAAAAERGIAVPGSKANGKANGHDHEQFHADWHGLIAGILTAQDYHNAIVRLASKLLRSGMSDGAAVNLIRGWMNASEGPRDERWQARYNDIPRAVSTARAKIGGVEGEFSPGAGQASEILESASAASFQMKAVQWLWPNRFAIGKLGIIAGLPDEGKGQILCDIIGRITSKIDKRWPCNEGFAPDGRVILLTAEDDPSDTVVPRLAAAAADLDRVEIVKMIRAGTGRRMFSLVTDLPLLRQKVADVGDVKAIMIDPVSAYFGHGKMDSFRTTDVRAVLGPVVELGTELKLAIIAIMHFNKKVDVTNALLRISDSLAFGAAARHVYGVVGDTENDRKLLVRAKNNLSASAKDKALAYRFGLRSVGSDPETGQEIWAPHKGHRWPWETTTNGETA
jgi:hypothetical protein